MFTPLILSALLPLNPALFLRELVQWFSGVFARTLADQKTRDWIKQHPIEPSTTTILRAANPAIPSAPDPATTIPRAPP
jgi:hypothetical protein